MRMIVILITDCHSGVIYWYITQYCGIASNTNFNPGNFLD